MSNNNERLAATIVEKLKEKGLIKPENASVQIDLGKGKIKEMDWKLALEEVLNTTEEESNEIQEENETE